MLLGKLLLAAICEEFFFRGLLLPESINRWHWPPIKATLGVSSLFAVLHLLNFLGHNNIQYAIVQVIFAFGISIFLCALYLKRGIVPCFLVHGLVNVVAALFFPEGAVGQVSALIGAIYIGLAVLSGYYGYKSLK